MYCKVICFDPVCMLTKYVNDFFMCTYHCYHGYKAKNYNYVYTKINGILSMFLYIHGKLFHHNYYTF